MLQRLPGKKPFFSLTVGIANLTTVRVHDEAHRRVLGEQLDQHLMLSRFLDIGTSMSAYPSHDYTEKQPKNGPEHGR